MLTIGTSVNGDGLMRFSFWNNVNASIIRLSQSPVESFNITYCEPMTEKQRARYRMSDWSEPWSIYVTSRADAFGTGRVGLLQLSDRHGHNNTYADLAQYVQPVSWSDFLAFMKDEHVSEWSTVEFLAWLDRTNRSAALIENDGTCINLKLSSPK